jgi:hypothetical protein
MMPPTTLTENSCVATKNWEIDMGKKFKMEPHPDYGDLFTMEEWKGCVMSGLFIDYDGFGNYATETEMSDIVVKPSDLAKGEVDESWSHVMWFNR